MKSIDYYSNLRRNELKLLDLKNVYRVLDVGCGIGSAARYLKKKKDLYYVGIEPFCNERLIEIDEIHNCFVEKFLKRYDGKKFDVILCLDVLEHIWDYNLVLKELTSFLTDDGVVLISVPNASNFRVFYQLFIKGDFPKHSEGIFDETHCRWFTKLSLSRDLVKYNFKHIKYTYTGMERFKPLYFLNILTLGLFKKFLGFQIVAKCKK